MLDNIKNIVQHCAATLNSDSSKIAVIEKLDKARKVWAMCSSSKNPASQFIRLNLQSDIAHSSRAFLRPKVAASVAKDNAPVSASCTVKTGRHQPRDARQSASAKGLNKMQEQAAEQILYRMNLPVMRTWSC